MAFVTIVVKTTKHDSKFIIITPIKNYFLYRVCKNYFLYKFI